MVSVKGTVPPCTAWLISVPASKIFCFTSSSGPGLNDNLSLRLSSNFFLFNLICLSTKDGSTAPGVSEEKWHIFMYWWYKYILKDGFR